MKSLVPFPVVLARLNNNLPSLQQLGYAFATQQADVFASIQRLRQRAQASGHLESSPQQVVRMETVTVEPGGGGAAAGGGEAGTQAAPAKAPKQQRGFASPEEAVTAFVAALRDGKEADLRAILGPEGDRVIDSGDRYADRELHERFVALYDEKHAIDLKGPGRAELDVGANDWPLPIPLVETDGRWTFDTKSGAQTIVDRRIGRNELSAIRTLLAGVDAQRDYFDRTKQANGTGVYATRLVSTQGHHDGLYWPVGEGERESPLGPLIDAAQDAGYPGELVGGKPIPYEGYYFRILSRQGPNADGGTRSYLHSGRMTGGFALIAWPAVFGSTGIMTFIVGPDGDVYQTDPGSETDRIARAMTSFDPDLLWSRVDVTNE